MSYNTGNNSDPFHFEIKTEKLTNDQHQEKTTSISNQILCEKLKQLESEQKILFEAIKAKTIENDLLKRNETKLVAEIYQLNEAKSKIQTDLLSEINDLKSKLKKLENLTSEGEYIIYVI
jgi:hypothetical protein